MVKNKKDLMSPRRMKSIRRSLTDKSHNSTKTSANFKVIIRIRPRNEKELSLNQRPIVKIADQNIVVFDPKVNDEPFFYHGVQQRSRDINKRPNKNIQFLFDTVFGPESTNEDVFNSSTKTLIQSIMDGYNCSVFVYGATGAGKTHTMIGQNDSPGITYLTVKELFEQMDILKLDREFELGITYLEVYNEAVNDLLNPGESLPLREDGKFGVCVSGITMKQISNPAELFELLKKGNGNRTQHPTDANAESSRSHAVFQVYVNMINRISGERRIAKLSMIDLAGSERGAATGCTGMRFTEGANINKSLLALGNCINSLADGQRHVPYRDSKLTRLLKDSLGGNCQTVMIANISPSILNYEDTYNTLRYATRAKKIKSNIKKNVIKNELTISQYKKLIEQLTKQNEELQVKLNEKPNFSLQLKSSKTTLPEIVIDSTKNSAWKENLTKLFKEKEIVQEKILKLENAQTIAKLKVKFKESTENAWKGLCNDNKQFEKGLTRIANQVEGFQHQIGSIKSQLKELFDFKNKLDCAIETLNIDGDEHIYSELRKKDELSDLKLKQMYYDKVFELFENELDQRDKVEAKMVNILKYYTVLNGFDHLTYEMKDEYKMLLEMIQRIRHVSWQNEDEIIATEEEVTDVNISGCSLLLSTGKSEILKNNLNQAEETFEIGRNTTKRKLDLVNEEDSSTDVIMKVINSNTERIIPMSSFNETFNLVDMCVKTPIKTPIKTPMKTPIKTPIKTSNIQVNKSNLKINSGVNSFKKDVHITTRSANILPKVLVKKPFQLQNKENKENKLFSVVGGSQRFATLRQKNEQNLNGVHKTITKKTIKSTKVKGAATIPFRT